MDLYRERLHQWRQRPTQVRLRSVFSDDDAGRYLFHYTRAETFMTHILPTSRLRMSSFKYLNDPRESKNWLCSVSIEPGVEGTWDVGAIAKSFTEQMKGSAFVLCFTRDDPNLRPDRRAHQYGRGYAHPSMWDRYAGGHSGVCLALDIDALGDDIAQAVAAKGELLYQGVHYDDMPPTDELAFTVDGTAIVELGEDEALRRHQKDHQGALYFYKSTDWKAEFEFRWVLLADDSSKEYYIDVSRSLKGVIFGDAFPEEAVNLVWSLLHPSGVQLARLKYLNGNPTIHPIAP